jgi:hypothetical protein
MLGYWRRVFDASDRAAAEKYAREQVRFGGAVSCIELRGSATAALKCFGKRKAGD